jgi:hypothetical protein
MPAWDDSVSGCSNIRERRSCGGCPDSERSEEYDVIVSMGPFQDLEMTMQARNCTEAGKPCGGAFTDRKGTISLKNGELVFGSDSLKRER